MVLGFFLLRLLLLDKKPQLQCCLFPFLPLPILLHLIPPLLFIRTSQFLISLLPLPLVILRLNHSLFCLPSLQMLLLILLALIFVLAASLALLFFIRLFSLPRFVLSLFGFFDYI